VAAPAIEGAAPAAWRSWVGLARESPVCSGGPCPGQGGPVVAPVLIELAGQLSTAFPLPRVDGRRASGRSTVVGIVLQPWPNSWKRSFHLLEGHSGLGVAAPPVGSVADQARATARPACQLNRANGPGSRPSRPHPLAARAAVSVEIEKGAIGRRAGGIDHPRKKRTSDARSALPIGGHRSGCRNRQARRGQRGPSSTRAAGNQAAGLRCRDATALLDRNTSARTAGFQGWKSLWPRRAPWRAAQDCEVGQLGLGDRGKSRRTAGLSSRASTPPPSGHFFERLRSAQWGKPSGDGLLTAEREDRG